ncbi:AraC family transcriptional regulator [Pandoraea communis]|uniref:AraC family transcriptional regulator n=1 Tax=Pandoraea communis TaxID=2508297 RepID=A0A5E4RI56_9BURK|nr:AraC family transcriptional regulator [Pandoraea communis]MDM8358884.1 AraC family transcriptional regulator [Pandoraea communis]VVD63030.1 AraC family transcriptional regulator [Pandoraea communis]
MHLVKNPPREAAQSEFADDPSLTARNELVGLLERATRALEGTTPTAVDGLFVHRILHPGGPKPALQQPAFAVIAQGEKRLQIGEEHYAYDPMHYMVSSVHLPVVAQVSGASEQSPYLGLRLNLAAEDVTSLIGDEHLPPPAPSASGRGLYVNRLDAALLDAVLRLLRLLETPRDIPILAPMIRREIVYRLLMNGQGVLLRQMALQDSQMNRIARAVRWLREHYAQPLRVEALAQEVHMSVSSLHHHFKLVTAMSPVQYQKQLRLQEARRLIFVADIAVAAAAQAVGYESASQFSREYARVFGEAPLRDKRRWLQDGDGGGATRG